MHTDHIGLLCSSLSEPICTVLGLPVIGGVLVEIVEDDLRGGRQVETRSTGNDVREEHDVVVLLKTIDQRLSLSRGHLASDHDGCRAECLRERCRGSST